MSFDALAWAGKCQPGSAPRKLVLLALADRHNPEGNVSYPSVAWLVDWTGLNRKTVMTALDALESQGLISDSGQRFGQTGQVKGYRLHVETVPKTEQFQKRDTIPKTGPLKSTVFTRKESQKRYTEPVREPVERIIPAEKKTSSGNSKAMPCPDGVDPDVWSDFIAHRKAKRATVTKTVMKDIMREAEKAGWTLEAALTETVARGWQGFKAEWVQANQAFGNRGSPQAQTYTSADRERLEAKYGKIKA